MLKIPTPAEIGLEFPIRKALGCISKQPVKLGRFHLTIRGYLLDYHDLYHLEVSYLERIQIGQQMVSGIHGIDSPIFHSDPIIEEYDGILDEVRVAIHEWLTRPSIYNTSKAVCWMFWLVAQRINPISVVLRHLRALRHSSKAEQLLHSPVMQLLENRAESSA